MYSEYAPHILLTPYIETYWSSEVFLQEEKRDIILPDGCVDIIFPSGDYCSEDFKTFSPYIIGTMTDPLVVSFHGKVNMLGIRFRPGGITAFTRMPVDELTNIRVDVALANTLFDSRFYALLEEAGSMEEKTGRLNAYFIGKLPRVYTPDLQVMHAVSLLRKQNGKTNIRELSQAVCLCQRHLERRFKAAVGVSPKTFFRIMRFQQAYRLLQKGKSGENLSDIAEICGYYDHSHLIKELKKYSGFPSL